MKQECTAHAELDQLWESKREREDDSAKWVVVVGEGFKKDWPEEEWEKKDTAKLSLKHYFYLFKVFTCHMI